LNPLCFNLPRDVDSNVMSRRESLGLDLKRRSLQSAVATSKYSSSVSDARERTMVPFESRRALAEVVWTC
jgi:hypothetical protein